MHHVEWRERPQLRSPALICAFKGWNDAGEAASAALGFLIESFDAREVARIDPEEFYDFTAVRPTVRMDEGRTRVIEWPSNSLHAATIPGTDHDLLMFQGVEPSLKWRTFTSTIVDMARELGAQTVVTLGALLADVPHTRDIPMTGICSDADLVERLGFQHSSYEGPTGMVGVLHHAFTQAGLPAVSLWASVPHYVAAAPNPKAALALIRSFEGVAGIAVDASDLEHSADEYQRQVDAAVATDPDVKNFVERLEQTLDEVSDELAPDPDQLPSADSIASDFQRFLRQKRAED
jgi:predicted ATP-grasp superfamily ATP-dependent carboligase